MNKWLLILAGIAMTAFAASRLLDMYLRRNILKHSQHSRMLLRRVQKTTAAAGKLAAVAMFYVLIGRVLGPFIS